MLLFQLNQLLKEFSLMFLCFWNLKTDFGSCKLIFQSNKLLKELSPMFLCFWNLKTDFGSCKLILQSTNFSKNCLSCFYAFETWKMTLAHVSSYYSQLVFTLLGLVHEVCILQASIHGIQITKRIISVVFQLLELKNWLEGVS